MRAVFLFIATALSLAGCVSAEQRQAMESAAVFSEQMQDAADDTKCTSFGTKLGTHEYVQCRMQLVQMRQQAAQTAQQQQAAALEAFREQQQRIYEQQMAGIRAANQPVPVPPPSAEPLTCTTNYVGNQAYTHCY